MSRAKHTLSFSIGAKPKARPRSGQGRTYMPKDYMDWKQSIAEEAIFKGAVLLGRPVVADFTFHKDTTIVTYEPAGPIELSRKGMLTGDVDNYIGGMMDALEGICWKNDRQLLAVTGRLV